MDRGLRRDDGEAAFDSLLRRRLRQSVEWTDAGREAEIRLRRG